MNRSLALAACVALAACNDFKTLLSDCRASGHCVDPGAPVDAGDGGQLAGDGDGGEDGGVPDAGTAIIVYAHTRYITTTSDVGGNDHPRVADGGDELSLLMADAGAPGGYQRFYPRQVDAGLFAYDGVPVGSAYFLQTSPVTLTETHARQVEVVTNLLGRPDQSFPIDPNTAVDVYATNLAPLTESDTLELIAFNAGVGYTDLVNESGGQLDAGDTSIALNLPWSYTGMPLIDADKGDSPILYQLSGTPLLDAAAVQIGEKQEASTVALNLTPPLVMQDGMTSSVRGSMTPIARDLSATVAFHGAEFAALTPQVAAQPMAYPPMLSFFIDPEKFARQYGQYAATPDVATVLFDAMPDAGVSLSFGNPFAASGWDLFITTQASWPVQQAFSLPDGGTRHANDLMVYFDQQLLPDAGIEVAPALGPPRNVRINGTSAAFAQIGQTETPLLEWDPPSLGTATGYRVIITRWYFDDQDVLRHATAFLGQTTAHSLQIPPGFMVPGFQYTIRVAAMAGPFDLETEPLAVRFPYAYAPMVSNVIEP